MIRLRGDRGLTIPLVALVLPVLIISVAFAIDLGRQRNAARDMQAAADVIALDMVRIIEGRDVATIEADSATITALYASADRNDVPYAQITGVVWGTFDVATTPKFTPAMANEIPNAVEITAFEETDYFWQPGTGEVTRTAVATEDKKAGFSIGSFAAAIDTGGSTLLNPLLGDALGIGVLGYDGLATTELDYADVAAELGLGTTEELFTGDVTAQEFLVASADILRRQDPSSAQVTVLDGVITSSAAGQLGSLQVEDVIDVKTGAESAAASAGVNLYDFLAAAAFISNGDAALAIPTISLGQPGFGLTGSLSLIQAPATVFGRVGDFAETSQASGVFTSTIGTVNLGNVATNTLNQIVPGTRDLLCGLLGLLPFLCGDPLHAVSLELTATVDIDLASALGTIARIECGTADELDIDVSSELLSVNISISAVLKTGTTTLGTFALSVANTRPPAFAAADFVIPPENLDEFKSATPGVGLLTGNTTINGVGAFSPLSDPVEATLNTSLNLVVSNVGTGLVNPLAEMLGARIASADVAARAISCDGVTLVG